MTVTSPNQYRKEARKKGVPTEVVDRALEYVSGIPEGVSPVLTLGHLCHYTEAPYGYLRDIVARHRDPYRIFSISKKSGGKRIITVPEPILLNVQRWLARNVFSNIRPHSSSCAFHPKSSIAECARQHLGARWLVKMDITNFFESIDEVQVFNCLNAIGFPNLVSFEIARIVTRISSDKLHRDGKWERKKLGEYKITKYSPVRRFIAPKNAVRMFEFDEFVEVPIPYGHLPQGAPTSPLLANLVMRGLDREISLLAAEMGFAYTRYADDLAFSSDSDSDEINRKVCAKLIGKVSDILTASGFQANANKTSVSPPGARKIVLGLLVDRDEIRLPRAVKTRILNHIRNIEKHGVREHATHLNFDSAIGMQRHVMGLLSYAKNIEPEFATPLIEKLKIFRLPL